MIAPAPRKPMPVTIWAAIRVGSARTTAPPVTRNSWKPYAEMIVKSAEPIATSMWVRKPASWSRSSRSIPTAPPSAAATTMRSSASSQESDGISASGIEGGLLRLANLGDALRSQVEQLVQPLAVERRALGGRLHLDQPVAAGHDDVQVDLGTRVLHVVEVEQQLAAHDSERHRCDRVRKHAREASLAERARGGDVRTRDRRAARAAVGL